MDNRRFNAHRRLNTAHFGYLEVVDRVDACQALLEAAVDWARAKGLDGLIGPRGLSASAGGGGWPTASPASRTARCDRSVVTPEVFLGQAN
jgi:hypothetical protein